MLHGDIPQERFQALRSVNKSIPPNSVPLATPDEIYHVDTLIDPETQKEVVLWDDILQAFKHAEQVRHKIRVVPFLKGRDLRILEPRRIAAIPNIVLDVIVDSPVADRGLTSSQVQPLQLPPDRPPTYESTIRGDIASSRSIRPISSSSSLFNVSSTASSTVQGTPVNGPGEAMMNNHPPINRSSSVAPLVRVPQVELHQQSRTSGTQAWTAGQNGRQPPGNRITTEIQSHGGRQSAIVHTSTTKLTHSERELVKTTNRANLGDKTAQVTLGDMYRDGKGVPRNYKVAMEWYLKAAVQRHPEGRHRLGNMYAFGLGVNKDHSTAMNWHLKAAEQGHPASQDFMGNYYNGVYLRFEQAMKWYHKAADQGFAPSQYSIGVLYNYGRGVVLDYVEARKWYMKAAKQGNADSQYRIGFLYQRGQGVVQDYAKALEWYQRAAIQGNWFAKEALKDLSRSIVRQ